jgi:hypothetical protein
MAFKNNPRIVSTGKSVLPELMTLPEAASQSFKKGELVYLVSGAVTVCAADATAIYGIAMEDASGVTSADIVIQPITPDCIVRMRLTQNGTDALTSDTDADIGVAFATYVASNVHYADLNDTGNDAFILRKAVKDPTGAATYWGDFIIVDSASQYHVGTAA